MNIKRYLFLLLSLLCIHLLYAQHIRVVAPKQVALGEEFQVEYTVFTQDVRRFQLGKLSSGIEKVFGPATSSQSSFRIVDGHTSSSSSMSFTYIFVATRKGALSIAPARIDVGGQTLASTPVHISVSGNSNVSRTSSGNNSANYSEDDYGASSSSIGAKDLFIKVVANKTSVYEQEPILLTYKVYTTKDLRKLLGKMPDLDGFHVQEIQLPQQKTFHKERVNGKTYNSVTWSQYVMYPQMTGTLKIPSILFKGLIHVGGGNFNPFEAFGIDDSQDIQRNVKAPGLKINVKPLPTAPAGFSGGVGHFNISAQISKKEVKAGDPISMRVVVSGTGNLKLIKQPAVQYPTDFETYDVKMTDKTRLTTKGVEGNVIYDQTIIPQKEGEFTIAPVKFVYFDLAQNRYVTLQTDPIKLTVLKGNNETSTSQKGENTIDGTDDIRPLKTTIEPKNAQGEGFFGSFLYWLIMVVLGGLIGGIAYKYKERFKNSSVAFKLKLEKTANKRASSRLDQAYAMMQRGDSIEFYDEISNALWGYVSDKLSLTRGELSRDNISEKLASLNIPAPLIDKFIAALDECEFERYAPGDERGNMKNTYNAAMNAISAIEEAERPSKNGRNMKSVWLILVLCLMSSMVSAQTVKEANQYYSKGNYAKAAKEYKALLKEGASSELYYNLGNAYFKQDSIASAILSYERALRLSPADDDIKFNLQLAQSKTIDNITPESEMFFSIWYRSLVSMMSADGWAWISILSLISIIVGMVVFLWIKKLEFRRKLMNLLALPVLVFVFSILFAWQQKRYLASKRYAIVISSSAVIRDTPDTSAKKSFILHEGTKLKITDAGLNGWCEFKLSDGRKGWIQQKQMEFI